MKANYYVLASYLPSSWQRSVGFTIRRVLAGADAQRKAKRLCVFASYDGQSVVDPYVLRYLERLRDAGFDIVFVTTSADLRAADADALRRLCRLIVLRVNTGYDFYSWKVGLQTVPDLEAYEKVALANDSVYGPFTSLEPLLARMDAEPGAFWGLCDSMDTGTHHLQSWFIYVDRSIVRSDFFRDFWRSVRIYRKKWDIIENCEIGFSVRAAAAGFPIRACFLYADLKSRANALGSAYQYRDELARADINPTLKMWDLLLRDFGFPFLKTELLKFNYYGAQGVEAWRKMVPASSEVALVTPHLKRIGVKTAEAQGSDLN